MFGDRHSRNAGLPGANLEAVSPEPLNPPRRRVAPPGFYRRICSTHRPSRTQCNSLKTRLRCHRYPSTFRDPERAQMRRQIDSAPRPG